MEEAVIVDIARTPLGKRNGLLKDIHPVDLAAGVLKTLVERSDLDAALIDDVIMGCVTQVGDQSLNVGRNVALAAGFPEEVVGTTVDRQCGSGQQALHFGAQGIMAGAYDVVIAGGVESMTRAPLGMSITPGGTPFGPMMMARYPNLIPQGLSAELIAERWKLSREQLDEYALQSQQRAAAATDEGRFANEIIPVQIFVENEQQTMDVDEGIRPDTNMEKMGKLKPSFKTDGVITAGNSSQISDGASAALLMSATKANELGLRPRARFRAFSLAGVDPVIMLTGPIPATTKVLERAKLGLDDMSLIEINEAFASVVLAWEHEHQPDMERVNVNGGAIALGHPLGASGARLCATLLNELERTGGRYGLQTMCEGGGMANAMIIERLA